MQNNVQISGKWSKSKPKVDFQYGRRFFSKTEVVISQPSIEICRRNLVWSDFDLLKAAISTNAKPEIVLLRFGRHIALSRWRPRPLNTQYLVLSTYLNWWLRYNYFRFWITNVRHIGNLLSISTICPKSAHYSVSGYRILSKSKHLLRKYDVMSRWRMTAILNIVFWS